MNEKLVNLKEKLIKEYSDFVISELKSVADNIMLDLSNTECMFEYSTLTRIIKYNLINRQELFNIEDLIGKEELYDEDDLINMRELFNGENIMGNLTIEIYADFEGEQNLYNNDKEYNLQEEYAYLKLYYHTKFEKMIEISTYKLEVKEDILNFLAYKPAKEQFEIE